MKKEKNNQVPLQFINNEALNSIYLQFASGINKKNQKNSQLFYNYECILALAEGLLKINIPQPFQSLINSKVAYSLLQKYSPSVIIYAIIINAFQYSSKLVNFHSSERNRFFISNHPTLATVFLQTFVNILEQRSINSVEYALQLLQRISAKIKEYLQQMRNDPSIISMTQQCSKKISIKTKINLVEAQKANILPDDLIYKSQISGNKGQLYVQLYNKMKQFFGEKSAKKLVEEVLMVFGAATYIETLKRQPKKINVQQPNNGFLMEMPFYGQLAYINSFSLQINFISAQPQTVLEIVLSFSSQINLIPIGEFNLRQKALSASIIKITDKQTVVQNFVYQMQKKSLLGKGSYGSVFRCDSLELIQQQIKDQARIFRFRRRKLAAKQLNLTQEERERLLIPANREHLILSLINQLRHREQINDCKRYLGFQADSSLYGIQNIIPMVEYFKLEYQNKKTIGKQQLQHFFLTFQIGNETLSNKDFLNTYAQSQPFFENLQFLFKKIFRGLSCLHYEIGQKYPLQLNRYYRIQNGDDNNHEKDPQQSLVLTRKNGIWLRDVKPSNVVVNFQGNRVNELWLIDFGMALIGQITIRNGATNCGSEYYMSPEVRNGMRQDQRVDVWSTGVILFEMYSRENRKLYSSIDVHVMNTVNQRISEQINNLTRDDQDWKIMMKAALTVKIENLRSSKEEATRKNSQQIVRLMDNKQIYLKKTDLDLLRKHFKEAKVYKCMQNCSNQNNQLLIEQVKHGFEWKQKDRYNFRHFFLRQYLKYSAYSPYQSLKIALVCLLHAQNINPNMSIDQLIVFLSQLQIFTAEQFKEANQTIFIKNRKQFSQKKVNLELIRDMQQIISFVTVTNNNNNRNSPVILSTDIVMKRFSPDFINCYSQESVNYFNGYSFQQGKIASRIYFADERYISDFKQVKQYTNQGRIFVTKTQFNSFEVFILNDLEKIYLSAKEFPQNELLPIVNEIMRFLMHQIEKYSFNVSFKEATNEFSRQNFAHLMKIEQINRKLLIIHYNKKTLSKILQNCSDAFDNKIKDIVAKIFKEDNVSMDYQIKQTLSLYLSCFKIDQFKSKCLSNKYSDYNLFTKYLKVFSEYLSFIVSQSVKLYKKSTKKALDIVKQWMNLIENFFGATFVQKQTLSEQSKLKLHQQIRFVRNYCEKLHQMPTLGRFSEIFKRTAQLGISLSDHLDILKILFDIK